MKIDQDIRAAIRSAEKCQPTTDWSVQNKLNSAAIEDFMKRFPAKAKRIIALVAASKKAEEAQRTAKQAICKQFGLRYEEHGNGSTTFVFANCGDGRGAFVKAGGKLPAKPGVRWKFDEVMVELAAAEPKQLKAILKKYGIRWE